MTGEVSPHGRDDEAMSPGQLRASYEDRDRVVELLRVAAGDGRLTVEELDERIEAALTARTYDQLAALVNTAAWAVGDRAGGLFACEPYRLGSGRSSAPICHVSSTNR
jgi:hypothetical protein